MRLSERAITAAELIRSVSAEKQRTLTAIEGKTVVNRVLMYITHLLSKSTLIQHEFHKLTLSGNKIHKKSFVESCC